MNSEDRSPTRSRARRARMFAVVGVAVLTAAACTSDPSAKRVAQDLVNTLVDDPAERDCMLDKIDEYSKDELDAIAENADQVGQTQNVGEVSELDQFQADLESCT